MPVAHPRNHRPHPHEAALESVLRNAGLRITRQRKQVLGALSRAPRHPMSVPDVYRFMLDSGDDLSPSTIHAVLSDMAFAELVIVHRPGRAKYLYALDPARRAQLDCPEE